MPAPVSVCLIVKNEEKQLESCLSSLRPHVEEICVVDTGSTDSTPDIARRFADKFEVYTGCNDSEGRITSFSDARTRSFELATRPWILWVDGDDEVRGAERLGALIQHVDRDRDGRPAMIMLPYEYSHDEYGNVTCLHSRERLVSPKVAFRWTNPVHEVLVPQVPDVHTSKTDDIRIVHRRNQSGKKTENGRNLRILKAHYEKHGESDVRNLYYLGLEYGNVGDVGSAIRFHKRYVELSGWDEERLLAHLEISKHYHAMGDYHSSIEWAMKAILVREDWAEPVFSIAKSYYHLAHRGGPDERRNWERCIHFARQGLAMPPTRTILFVDPMERAFDIHRYLNVALSKVGDVEGAVDSCRTALAVRPDPGLQSNLDLYEVHLAKCKITDSVNGLIRLGKMTPEGAAIVQQVVDGRFEIRGPEAPAIAVPSVLPASEPPPRDPSSKSLDIIMYVGSGPERWNPQTFSAGGLGGSETMAWEMARRLVRLGHRVRFFGDCQGMEGNFEGVEFLDHAKYGRTECDVLLTSRKPDAVDDSHEVKARARVCWVHDVHCGYSVIHSRAVKIDRFLCLSQWHKGYFLNWHSNVHPDQVVVTRNGIDLSRFEGAEDRNPRRIIYSSSPDRGLQTAIYAMPRIREQFPGAELHVFYGFENWIKSCGGDPLQLDLIRHLRALISSFERHGVVFHDRVDQKRLAREFMKSSVWGYPTWFSETSCITAMEAQAAGCRIVTSPIAALNETVGDRGQMIHGDWLSEEYMRNYVGKVVEALSSASDSDRESVKSYARENFGLDSLAQDWSLMLHRIVEEVEWDIVPPYKAVI